eukprot:scaffold108950_cov32-Tisochrysis_lutea.AAC.4
MHATALALGRLGELACYIRAGSPMIAKIRTTVDMAVTTSSSYPKQLDALAARTLSEFSMGKTSAIPSKA